MVSGKQTPLKSYGSKDTPSAQNCKYCDPKAENNFKVLDNEKHFT